MKNLLLKIAKKIKEHFSYFQELYFWPLLVIALVFGSIYGVLHFTAGNNIVISNPGVLVDFAYQFFGFILISIAVVNIDPHAFHDLNKAEWNKATIWEKVLDVTKTLVLFLIALWFFKG